MLEKEAIKNGQSIETDNCIATFIYILSFTDTIFMYQAQLITIRKSKKDRWYTGPTKDSKERKGQTTTLKDLWE
jgi:hypothetical protein